jgi:hypothetical protein
VVVGETWIWSLGPLLFGCRLGGIRDCLERRSLRVGIDRTRLPSAQAHSTNHTISSTTQCKYDPYSNYYITHDTMSPRS